MSERTAAEEAAVFKKRVEQLFAKEARCPACKKVRAGLPPNAAQVPCEAHKHVRYEMAISGMKTWD